MKIKLLSFFFFLGCFVSTNAQRKLQVGVNVFNSLITFPDRLELSFQMKNKYKNSQINPVLIMGTNNGKKFITHTKNNENTQNIPVNSQITHQYSTRSQYIKAGIDLITKSKENGCDNYAEFLLGYSKNTAINKVTMKGNYFEDFHYVDETTFKAIIFQMWYISEFKIYEDFLGSLGIGVSTLGINSNSNPNAPISEVGGGAYFFSLENDIQYYITPTIKFSVHYKF